MVCTGVERGRISSKKVSGGDLPDHTFDLSSSHNWTCHGNTQLGRTPPDYMWTKSRTHHTVNQTLKDLPILGWLYRERWNKLYVFLQGIQSAIQAQFFWVMLVWKCMRGSCSKFHNFTFTSYTNLHNCLLENVFKQECMILILNYSNCGQIENKKRKTVSIWISEITINQWFCSVHTNLAFTVCEQ